LCVDPEAFIARASSLLPPSTDSISRLRPITNPRGNGCITGAGTMKQDGEAISTKDG
jgi:hypothetical protein